MSIHVYNCGLYDYGCNLYKANKYEITTSVLQETSADKIKFDRFDDKKRKMQLSHMIDILSEFASPQ